jgi:hypothetical protein
LSKKKDNLEEKKEIFSYYIMPRYGVNLENLF